MSTSHLLLERGRDAKGALDSGYLQIYLDEHSTLHDLRIDDSSLDTPVEFPNLTEKDMIDLALRILAVCEYTHGDETIKKRLAEYLKDSSGIMRTRDRDAEQP